MTMIFEDLISVYLQKLTQRNYSPQTLRSYQCDLQQFATFLREQNCSLDLVSLKIARQYLVSLREKNINERSIRRHFSTLKNFFKYLQKDHQYTENPFMHIKTPKIPQRLPSCLVYRDITTILAACEDSYLGRRDRAILEFLYSCGLRAFELVKMNTSDVIRRVIPIEGKGKKVRLVFLGPPAWKALEDYLPLRSSYVCTDDEDANLALFLNEKGKRLTTRGLFYIVKKYEPLLPYGQKIGVHLFRHTFATHLLDEGADLRIVQEMLGHQHLSTTQIYTHVGIEKLKQIYRKAHPHAQRTGK
ncbi:MAG: tyrosine-type recombinase/integrase [Spirochaetia bacterium]